MKRRVADAALGALKAERDENGLAGLAELRRVESELPRSVEIQPINALEEAALTIWPWIFRTRQSHSSAHSANRSSIPRSNYWSD